MNVLLAKANLLPSVYAGVQTADPLSTTDVRGAFFSIGLSWPIWDGFKRYRNIGRQKTILEQYATGVDTKEIEFAQKWQEVKDQLKSGKSALKLSQAGEELARLRNRQSEIRYKSEVNQLRTWLEGQKVYLEAQKNTTLKALDYNLVELQLRYLSGELVGNYVDESSWQKN
jgi:outer membrane protein TolC